MHDPTHALDAATLLAEEDFARRLARALVFDDDSADDVVQQTWIDALRSPHRIDRAAARGWLATVIRRRAADFHAARRRRRVVERDAARDEVALPSADDLLAREEARRAVIDELRRLDEPFRTAVALRYLEGLDPTEIATRQGVPASTVRGRVRRGLARLREALDRRHGGERASWSAALLPLAGPRPSTAAPAVPFAAGPAWKLLLAAAAVAISAALIVSAWPGPSRPLDTGIAAVVAPPPAEPDGDAGARLRSPPTRAAANVAPEAIPRPTGGLRGRLLGPGAVPLTNAEVLCVALAPWSSTREDGLVVERSVRTDMDGGFVVDRLPPGARCRLVADVTGDLRQALAPQCTVPREDVADLGTLQLDPRAVVIGRVVDATGAAIEDAEVLATDLPEPMLRALGLQHLDPRHGIVLTIPRFAGDPERFVHGARAAIAAIGSRPASEPEPATHTPVVLDGPALASLWRALGIAHARTDRTGRFRLAGVGETDRTIVVRHPRFVPTIAPRDGTAELTAEPGATWTGRVTTPAGDPVADAEVRIAPVESGRPWLGAAPLLAAMKTGADGTFSVPAAPAGRAVVLARPTADAPWRLVGTFAVGEPLHVELARPEPALIDVALPDGVNADELRVEVTASPVRGEFTRLGLVGEWRPVVFEVIDSDRLRLPSLAGGTWAMRFTRESCAPVTALVQLPAGEPTRVVLHAAPPRTLRVVDPDGRPVADAEVLAADPDAITGHRLLNEPDAHDLLARSVGRTDREGRCRIGALPRNWRLLVRSATAGLGERRLTAGDGSELTIPLTGRGTLLGTVDVPPTLSRPLVRRVPHATSLEHRWSRGADVVALGADDDFSLVGVPAGSHTLELVDGGTGRAAGAIELLTAAIGPRVSRDPTPIAATSVEVRGSWQVPVHIDPERVPGAATRRFGRVTVDGAATAGLRVEVLQDARPTAGSIIASARTDADGRYSVRVPTAATGVLVIRDPRQRLLHAARIGPLDDPRHDVFVRTGRLHGVVRSADRRPVADAPVTLVHRPVPDTPDIACYGHAITDADGSFAIDELIAGRYRIEIAGAAIESPLDVDVPPGAATPQIDLELIGTHDVMIRVDEPFARDPRVAGAVELVPVGVDTGVVVASNGDRFRFWVEGPGPFEVFVHRAGRRHRGKPATLHLGTPRTEVAMRIGEPAPHR